MRNIARSMVAALALLGAVVLPGGAAEAAPARYDTYYKYFDTGNAKIPWHDTRWIPQGLTKYGENKLVIAYYDYYGSLNSRLALIDRASGKHLKTFYLPFKSHVGGIAATSKFLFVTSNSSGGVAIFNRSQLGRASGSTLKIRRSTKLAASSYAFAQGDDLWVGKFNSGSRDYMYRYDVSTDGYLTRVEKVYTPSKVQGVVVTGTRIVWSQSYGRTNDSKLIVWRRGTTYDGSSKGRYVTAPNMSQGMVIAGGRLQVVYESGAVPYVNGADGKGKADYVIRSVHHGSIPPLP